MKNTIKGFNKQGFSSLVVLVALALLVLAGSVGYVYLQPKQEAPKPSESKPAIETTTSAPVPSDETSTWKTYRNEQYGFEVRYPQNYYFSEPSYFNPSVYGPININSYKIEVGQHGVPLGNIAVGIYIYEDLPYKNVREWMDVNQQKFLELQDVLIDGVEAVRSVVKNVPRDEPDAVSGEIRILRNRIGYQLGYSTKNTELIGVFNQILSTFKFIKNSAEIKQPPAESIAIPSLSLPTACIDEQEGVPVITSLSNYSGSVGTKLEIRGCNFSGFEGDKNAWIENSQDVVGLLYGEAGSTGKLLKITLKSPLCQSDTSYIGLPCSAWLTLTPGTYKIYTMPWGKKSNVVSFTIK